MFGSRHSKTDRFSSHHFNFILTGKLLTVQLINVDLDEVTENASSHLGLHYRLHQQ